MVTQALNAVAMIFNSPTYNGGSLIALALIIALMFTVLPAMSGGKPHYVALLTVFAIYFAGIQPKMRLNIEDYYTGQISSVDNIPLIVGMPASIGSDISYELSKLIEGIMTTPQTNTTFRDGGFSDPLKLIYSLRPSNRGVASSNGDWAASFESYIRDCARWSPNWAQQAAMESPALSTYLLDSAALPVAGLTVYYDSASPQGRTMDCQTAQNTLKTVASNVGSGTNPLVSAVGLSKIIKASDSDRPMPISAGTEMTKLTSAFNDVTNGALTGQQDAQQFIVNMIAMQPLKNGIRCGNATASEYNGCLANAQIFTAQEQSRLDDAAGASIFAKTMIPMMNIVMLLFYLFSPILLVVAMMFATKSLQIMAGYIMFAVWTQSWLPTAMVINYIIQMQAADALSQVASGGVTMMNVHQFYEVMATKIGLASELFAAVPVLTMALLSGSVYGLTQLSGAMSQKDHFNEKVGAPDVGDNAPITKNGPLVAQAGPVYEKQNRTGEIGNGDAVRSGGQEPFKKLSLDASSGEEVGRQQSIVSASQHASQEAASHGIKKAVQEQGATKFNESLGRTIQQGNSKATSDIKTVSSNLQRGLNLTDTESAEFTGMVGAGIGEGISPVQLQAKLAQRFGAQKAKTIAANFAEDSQRSNRNELSLSRASSHAHSKDFSDTLSKSMGVEDAKNYSDSISQTETAQQQLAAAQKRQASFGVGWSGTSDKPASTLLRDHGYSSKSALDSMRSSLNDEQKERFDNLLSIKKELGEKQGQRGAVSEVAFGLEAMGEIDQNELKDFMIDSHLVTQGNVGDGGVAAASKPLETRAGESGSNAVAATAGAPTNKDAAKLEQTMHSNYRPISKSAVNGQVGVGQSEISHAQKVTALTGQQLTPEAATPVGGPDPTAYQDRLMNAGKNAGVLNSNGTVSSTHTVAQGGASVASSFVSTLQDVAGDDGPRVTPEDMKSVATGGVVYNKDMTEAEVRAENPGLVGAKTELGENTSAAARFGRTVRAATGAEDKK